MRGSAEAYDSEDKAAEDVECGVRVLPCYTIIVIYVTPIYVITSTIEFKSLLCSVLCILKILTE